MKLVTGIEQFISGRAPPVFFSLSSEKIINLSNKEF